MMGSAALCRKRPGFVLVDRVTALCWGWTAQFAGAGSACVAVLTPLLTMHERWAARIYRKAGLQLLGCG